MLKPIISAVEAALRKVPAFSDLLDKQLQWFATSSEEIRLAAGEVLFHEGHRGESLFVLLEGEVRGSQESRRTDGADYLWRTGDVIGLLSFSRMENPMTGRLTAPCWILRLPKSRFEEMYRRIPELLPRLLDELTGRIQEYQREEQQRQKLSALGKLSAGLAHELNNPASAAHRAAERLGEYLRDLPRINRALDEQSIPGQERSWLASFEENLLNPLASPPLLDALEQSDLEQELEAWLNRHDIANAAELASGLVEAGVDRVALDELGVRFGGGALSTVLAHVVTLASAERLTREIGASTGRISELVQAIKEYTYMDRAPEQEIDVHRGIESTLTILKFRLTRGVEVKREFDPDLPRVFANGCELNQVWTNLIENAIDAMGGRGELRIRTFRELDCVGVEIIDNGPGVPDNVKPHIFEPFFTTKGVGDGTGLGLDTVYRLVGRHRGKVSFTSRPGHTSFQVRIPINPGKSTYVA